MKKINMSEVKVSHTGNATTVEHVPTGISVTEVSAASKEKNYINALNILIKRIENHFSLPLRRAC